LKGYQKQIQLEDMKMDIRRKVLAKRRSVLAVPAPPPQPATPVAVIEAPSQVPTHTPTPGTLPIVHPLPPKPAVDATASASSPFRGSAAPVKATTPSVEAPATAAPASVKEAKEKEKEDPQIQLHEDVRLTSLFAVDYFIPLISLGEASIVMACASIWEISSFPPFRKRAENQSCF
jgi:hypothetical protein